MLPLNLPKPTHYSPSSTQHIQLTSEGLLLLEKSQIFSPGEKVHILALFLGKQHITDIGIDCDSLVAHQRELNRLKVPYIIESWRGESWLLAGTSSATLQYTQTHRDTLSEIEAGILYGYPPTATLAFSGLLSSRRHPPISPATFFFAGVYSESFFDEEVAYYEDIWCSLKKASPRIVDCADSLFKKIIAEKKEGF